MASDTPQRKTMGDYVFEQAPFEYDDLLRTHFKCLRTTPKTNRTQGVLNGAGTGWIDLNELPKISKPTERDSL